MPDVSHTVLGRAPVVFVLLRRILIVLEASWRPHFDTVQDSRPREPKIEASDCKTLASRLSEATDIEWPACARCEVGIAATVLSALSSVVRHRSDACSCVVR